MANKEFSNVYQSIDFCNNIKTYCLYALFFRHLKIAVITDTDCSIKGKIDKFIPNNEMN